MQISSIFLASIDDAAVRLTARLAVLHKMLTAGAALLTVGKWMRKPAFGLRSAGLCAR
jgi:hypothetical protein